MKAASFHQLKKELAVLESSELRDCIMRLVGYKKENKELLSYLLFEASNEKDYVDKIKEELNIQFQEINKKNYYWIKKSLRKILKNTTKYIKYSGSTQTEVELLIHFCQLLKRSGIKIEGSTSLINLRKAQLKKINQSLNKMHEDLQFDYHQMINEL